MTDDLRAAALAAMQGGKWVADRPGMRFVADENAVFRALASPDRILALCDENKELRAALKSLTEAVEWIFAETDELTARGPMQRAHAKARAALEGKP